MTSRRPRASISFAERSTSILDDHFGIEREGRATHRSRVYRGVLTDAMVRDASHALRAPLVATITALLLLGVSCAGWRHGYTTARYQGLVLPTRGTGPGAERLKIEADYDSDLRAYVQNNGPPDYIYVLDDNRVELIYLASDSV